MKLVSNLKDLLLKSSLVAYMERNFHTKFTCATELLDSSSVLPEKLCIILKIGEVSSKLVCYASKFNIYSTIFQIKSCTAS